MIFDFDEKNAQGDDDNDYIFNKFLQFMMILLDEHICLNIVILDIYYSLCCFVMGWLP